MMRIAYNDFRQYTLFYSVAVITCPLLYMALIWLENWSNAP